MSAPPAIGCMLKRTRQKEGVLQGQGKSDGPVEQAGSVTSIQQNLGIVRQPQVRHHRKLLFHHLQGWMHNHPTIQPGSFRAPMSSTGAAQKANLDRAPVRRMSSRRPGVDDKSHSITQDVRLIHSPARAHSPYMPSDMYKGCVRGVSAPRATDRGVGAARSGGRHESRRAGMLPPTADSAALRRAALRRRPLSSRRQASAPSSRHAALPALNPSPSALPAHPPDSPDAPLDKRLMHASPATAS